MIEFFSSVITVVNSATKNAFEVARLFFDRTKLVVHFPGGSSRGSTECRLQVQEGCGLFWLIIETLSSRRDVMIKEVKVSSDASLQFSEIEGSAFNKVATGDSAFPFAMVWNGNVLLKARQPKKQDPGAALALGLIVKFASGIHAREVKLTIIANTVANRVGYIVNGENERIERKIVLRTSDALEMTKSEFPYLIVKQTWLGQSLVGDSVLRVDSFAPDGSPISSRPNL